MLGFRFLHSSIVGLFRCIFLRHILILGAIVICYIVGLIPFEGPKRARDNFYTKSYPIVSNVRIDQNETHNMSLSIKKHFEQREGGILQNQDIGETSRQNQTLENLKNNLTLVKANMSDIGGMLKNLNTSVNIKNVPNPHPFKYLIYTNNVCKTNDLFILAYVHTDPSHFKRRMMIRETWGNPKYHSGVKMRLLFVLGKTDGNASTQEALQFEAQQYQDIIQEDFQDTYKNLTYKAIAALKWIDNNCRNAKFILKSDDDVFINIFSLIRHLQSIDRLGKGKHKDSIMCLTWTDTKVRRTGKWKVVKKEYKDEYYPTYCSGSAFVMTTDVAIALHNISYHIPFFWVDDFYITGLLPFKIGTIKHKTLNSWYVLDEKTFVEKFTGSNWLMHIFAHVHDLNAIQLVWKKLVKLAAGEMRSEIKYALPGQLPQDSHQQKKHTNSKKKK